MPEIGAARGVTKHTDLTNKEDALGVIDHANSSVTMAKLVQEVQDLINGALQRSGGTMTGNIDMLADIHIDPDFLIEFRREPTAYASIYCLPDTGLYFSVAGARKFYFDKNINMAAGKTVDGVDVSEHVTASPIDHPDASITPAKLSFSTWEVIAEVVLTETVDYVQFTDLDINTDKLYALFLNPVNAWTSSKFLYLFVNDDEDTAHYYAQRLVANNTTLTPIRVNAPECGYLYLTYQSFGFIYLVRDYTGYVRTTAMFNIYPPNLVVLWYDAMTSVNTFTNVTSLKIIGSTPGTLAAGSVFLLCRVRSK